MNRTVPRRLRLEWTVATLAGVATLAAGRAAFDHPTPTAADRWVVVTGGVLAFELWFLRRNLGDNRPDGHDDADGRGGDHGVRPALGRANYVTLGRGWLYAAVAGFVVVPPATTAVAWAPALLYGTGATLDFVDGTAARNGGRRTELGRKLDLAFDTLGFLVAPLVGVAWGRLPVWYLSISVARYLYRGGIWWHERRGGRVGDLPESRVRRPLAGLQMAFIAVALAPVLPTSVVYPLAAVVATPSLVVFARDFLVVTRGGEGKGEP